MCGRRCVVCLKIEVTKQNLLQQQSVIPKIPFQHIKSGALDFQSRAFFVPFVSMSVSTRVTKLFNIKHPLILPGMSWISTPQLVAAVSNAGGLGILATGPLSAEQTRESIREIRRLTDKPFGIGATLLMPGATENAKVALEEKVPVINFSLGKGEWLVKEAHKYGGKVIATVVSEKHAKSAESIGADCLMVTGK